jgi:hypothetical protein
MVSILLTAAALALPGQLPPPLPNPVGDDVLTRLVDGLDDRDFEVRQNLAAALARLGPRAVPPLRDALKGGTAYSRAGAAYALGLLGDAARPALGDLLDLLKDADTDVRRQASFALSRVVPAARVTPTVTAR